MTTPIPDAALDEWERLARNGAQMGCNGALALIAAYRESQAEAADLLALAVEDTRRRGEAIERAEQAEQRADALRAGIEAMSGDLWRVTPCGCGHRADLHADAGCTAGLTLCGCRWTFTTVLQERLRSLLSTSTDQPEGDS